MKVDMERNVEDISIDIFCSVFFFYKVNKSGSMLTHEILNGVVYCANGKQPLCSFLPR